MSKLLSFLFPVKLPKMIKPELLILEIPRNAEGSIGRVQIKKYSDAIDRHWKELKTNELQNS